MPESKSIQIGDIHAGRDVILGDQIIGYTIEQVRELLEQLRREFQPRPFDGTCPYVGLRPFTEQDAERFFGREQLVEKLLQQVEKHPAMFVAGPSGSGKSSLARAGLIPALKSGRINGSERWLYAIMTPGRDPLEALATAFARLKSPQIGDYLREAAGKDTEALHKATEAILSDDRHQRLVLLIDQFEEIFTQAITEETRQVFLTLLSRTLVREDSRLTVLFILRSDFISHCAAYPVLNEWLNRQFFQVGAMTPDELVRAIALPAEQVGLHVEPELIAQIIADMGGQPGVLPLMQFALADLFEAQREQGGVIALRRGDYLARGGIYKALERHAEQKFGELSPVEQRLAEHLFRGLVEIGIGTPDTRRTARFEQIILAEVGAEVMEALIRKLADARLIITAKDENVRTITLAHEKLMDAWPWLRNLIDENRQVIALQNRLTDDAHEWDEHGCDPSYLYRGARLATVREKMGEMTLSERALAFVQASLHAEEESYRLRERRRRQLMFVSVGAAFVFLLLALLAWGQRNEAISARATAIAEANVRATAQAVAVEEAQVRATAQAQAEDRRREAEAQRQIAVSQRLMTQAQLLYEESSDLPIALLLAVESFKRHPNSAVGLFFQHTLDHLQKPLARLEHEKAIISATFSFDNRLLFVITSDGAMHIWDWLTQKKIRVLIYSEPIERAILSPDGHMLAIVTGNSVHFEDTTVWQEAMGLKLEISPALLEFSPDWHWMAFVSESDNTVMIWDVLSGQPISHLIHESAIHRLSFSPDSRWLATVSGSTVRVWDVVTGREVISGKSNLLTEGRFTFSPDSRLIACWWVDDNRVVVWDVSTEQEVAKMVYEGEKVRLVEFTPDGDKLIVGLSGVLHLDYSLLRSYVGRGGDSGGIESEIEIWRTQDWQKIALVRAPVGDIFEFHHKGQLVATGQGDEWVYIWSIKTGEIVRKIDMSRDVDRVRWDPDDYPTWIASVPAWRPCIKRRCVNALEVWDLSTGLSLAQLPCAYSNNCSYEFSHDGKYVVGWGYDHNIALIWELEPKESVALTSQYRNPMPFVLNLKALFSPDGRWILLEKSGATELWELWKVPADGVKAGSWVSWYPENGETLSSALHVTFSRNDRWIASGGQDSVVRIWDVSTGREVSHMAHEAAVFAIDFNIDGRFLVSGSADRTARVWELLTGQEISRVKHEDGVNHVGFSPDGRLVFSADAHTIRIWELLTGHEISRVSHEDQIREVIFSQDGRLVLSTDDYATQVWEAATGKEISRITYSNKLSSVDFTADGSLMISVEQDDKRFVLWNTERGEEVAEFETSGVAQIARFSPDGKFALGVEDNSIVHIWEIPAMYERLRFEHARLMPHLTSFSPDGRWVLTVGFDGRTLIWKTDTGEIVAELWQPDSLVSAAAFSPDGSRVVMAGVYNNTIRTVLWQPQDLVAEACTRLTRNLTRDEWQRYIGDEPYRPTCPGLLVPGE